MRNTTATKAWIASIFFGLSLLLDLSVHSASAEDSPELHCRRAIGTALYAATVDSFRERLRCKGNVIVGLKSPSTDCLFGSPGSWLRDELDELSEEVRGRLVKACDGVSWGLLSYPGPCESSPAEFGAATLADCIDFRGAEIAGSLFDAWYPPLLLAADGAAAECMASVPKRAASAFLREARTRLRCLVDEEAAPLGVDCRGLLPPYGPGTGVGEIDDRIVRSQRFSMPTACWRADFAQLGYQCPTRPGEASGILDVRICVEETNRHELLGFLDLAFPSDPVCGNGVKQEGEDCDNGVANSDTRPDACRLDCMLPVCGDHVPDPGNHEQCDDGNSTDLDGCTTACVLERCGDGITNNLPNEQCDDQNANDHDRCTGSCKQATCGDGVVCSDPTCTTGPGGGPEQCDQGTANSETGVCKTDCSGFSRICTLTFGVTNSISLGALTYEVDYQNASGEMAGVGGKVQCKSSVTGGLVSIFDNDAARVLKESLIADAGLATPAAIATCTFATNTSIAAGDFLFIIDAASDPDFEPVSVTMAVTSIVCQ